MFRVKICGITEPGDALAAADAGADAIGLNFFAGSKRYVDVARAAEIAAAAPPRVIKAGVFVNAKLDIILDTRDAVGLHLIQLHGDEPPELLAELKQASAGAMLVLRAFRLGPRGLSEVQEYLARCEQLDCVPALVLLDAYAAGSFGGTGETCDWRAAAHYHALKNAPPLVLAGGLTPDNIAAAIRAVRPFAVDTASGVELSPGLKDTTKLRHFIAEAMKELALQST